MARPFLGVCDDLGKPAVDLAELLPGREVAYSGCVKRTRSPVAVAIWASTAGPSASTTSSPVARVSTSIVGRVSADVTARNISRLSRELRNPALDQLAKCLRHRQRSHDDVLAGVAERARKLQREERVSPRSLRDALQCRPREYHVERLVQDASERPDRQCGDRHALGLGRHVERDLQPGFGPPRDDRCRTSVPEASERVPDRTGGFHVQPLDVVDGDDCRRLLREEP